MSSTETSPPEPHDTVSEPRSEANANRVPAGRWLVRGALLLVLAFANLNDIWSPDVIPNALLSWTLIREGDADYDEFVRTVPVPGSIFGRPSDLRELQVEEHVALLDWEAYFFRACGESTATEPPTAPRSPGGPPAPARTDRVCSIFPPGIGLLALPFFAPFALAGRYHLDLGLLVRVGHLAAATFEVTATLLLWSTIRRFANERWALALVLLYFLATSVRTVASQALWQHSGVHLALALALWLTLHERPTSLAREAIAGLLLGLGIVVRQTVAIVAGAQALAAAVVARSTAPALEAAERAGVLVGATVVAGALPLFAYNWLALGSPLEQGYGPKPFDTPLLTGLYGLLLSPSRGFLIYEPYLLAGLAALALAWRRDGAPALRLRALSISWLATLLLYAAYTEWWGGRVFGPRFLDDLAPILFVALAWGIGQGLLARRAARRAFWAAAAWSLLIFQAAAFAYDPNKWDTVPVNVNFDPARLFDWTDPQWLAVLASVPAAGPRVLVAVGLSAISIAVLLRLEGIRPPSATPLRYVPDR